MAVKLTKNELKVQKDRLKQFQRYLPTLQLKKQQLQAMVTQTAAKLEAIESERLTVIADLDDWVAVFAENNTFPQERQLETLVRPLRVVCREDNIAGVTVPVFVELTFEEIVYDVSDYPLAKELRSTAQRVNLFEKVKIPETRENIRVIGIYLGDQQTSAVVRGKIAKKKLEESNP